MKLELDWHDVELDAETVKELAKNGKVGVQFLTINNAKTPKRKYRKPQLVICYLGRSWSVKGRRLDDLIDVCEHDGTFACGIRPVFGDYTVSRS